MGNIFSRRQRRFASFLKKGESIREIDPSVLEARRAAHENKRRYAVDMFESEHFRPNVYAIRGNHPARLFNTTTNRIDESASVTGIWYLQDLDNVYGPLTTIPNESTIPRGWYRVYEMMAGFTDCQMQMCRYIGALEI